MSENNEIVVSTAPSGQLSDTALAQQLGETYGMPAQSIANLIRAQIIAVPQDAPPATPAELAVVMSVMRQYGLNPMLKQIHAWRDNKGRLAVMVGYDGWQDYARRQPTYQFVSYKFGPIVDTPDKKGCKCWEWVQPIIHDEKYGQVEMVPVYLEEWYVKQRGNYPEPWQKQTKHRLHLKAFTSAIREFYGIGGVLDEVDRDVMSNEYHRTEFATEDAAKEMAGEMAVAAAAVVEPAADPVADPASAAIESYPCADCTTMTSVRCLACGAYVCAQCMAEDGSQCATCAAKEGADG
jgi:hypothetical protein